MNNLSWFLYIAEVIPNLGRTFGLIGGIGVAVFGFWGFMSFMMNGTEDEISSPSKSLLVVSVLLIIISTLIPSSQTLYLIAGSEAGEAVVASETGQEIMDDIHEAIKFQLKSLKGE